MYVATMLLGSNGNPGVNEQFCDGGDGGGGGTGDNACVFECWIIYYNIDDATAWLLIMQIIIERTIYLLIY